MTHEELREAVVQAMNAAALKARTENPDIPDEEYDAAQADAALAVVREALGDLPGLAASRLEDLARDEFEEDEDRARFSKAARVIRSLAAPEPGA